MWITKPFTQHIDDKCMLFCHCTKKLTVHFWERACSYISVHVNSCVMDICICSAVHKRKVIMILKRKGVHNFVTLSVSVSPCSDHVGSDQRGSLDNRVNIFLFVFLLTVLYNLVLRLYYIWRHSWCKFELLL